MFALRQANNQTVILRIADPHTGHPLSNVTHDDPIFDLMQQAYFRNLSVELCYRDFGPDSQSGINNLCIDRVSLTQ